MFQTDLGFLLCTRCSHTVIYSVPSLPYFSILSICISWMCDGRLGLRQNIRQLKELIGDSARCCWETWILMCTAYICCYYSAHYWLKRSICLWNDLMCMPCEEMWGRLFVHYSPETIFEQANEVLDAKKVEWKYKWHYCKLIELPKVSIVLALMARFHLTAQNEAGAYNTIAYTRYSTITAHTAPWFLR